MIRFPSLEPRPFFRCTVPMPCATSPPLETPCSSSHSCSISAPPLSLRSRILPSAASQSPSVLLATMPPALPSSSPPTARLPPIAPATVPYPSHSPSDRFPVHPLAARSAFVFATAPHSAPAAGRSNNSQRSGTPTSQNLPAPRTAATSDTPAKTPPAPLLPRPAGSPSSGMPFETHSGYVALRGHDTHPARPPACVRPPQRRWFPPQPSPCPLAFPSLDSISLLRLGPPGLRRVPPQANLIRR